MHNFYPRPPRGGRRIAVCRMGIPRKISIHALREEGDRFRVCLLPQFRISIHALREEGDIWKALCWSRPILISIHALREEGDLPKKCRALPPPYFYPRPPRGGRQWQDKLIAFVQQFLSTPSARRATLRTARASCCRTNFYPRPPRGGRQRLPLSAEPLINFYPRPPRGGRRDAKAFVEVWRKFLSTPSARRATRPASRKASAGFYFYPRPPRGGRRSQSVLLPMTTIFLSTPSARRATSERIPL